MSSKKASEHGIEIRNLMLGTHQLDKTNQLKVFFEDDEKRLKSHGRDQKPFWAEVYYESKHITQGKG